MKPHTFNDDFEAWCGLQYGRPDIDFDRHRIWTHPLYTEWQEAGRRHYAEMDWGPEDREATS